MAGFNPYFSKATAKRLGDMKWFRVDTTTVARKARASEMDFSTRIAGYDFPLMTAGTFKEACQMDGLTVYVQANGTDDTPLEWFAGRVILEAVRNHSNQKLVSLRFTEGKSVNIVYGQALQDLMLGSMELDAIKRRNGG